MRWGLKGGAVAAAVCVAATFAATEVGARADIASPVPAGQAASSVPGVEAGSAVAGPDGPLGHAGRWITDGEGRVVMIHGVNVPSKTLPAYPSALGFGDDDATLLAASGFNAVRITVERYAVEPTPGHFDDAYVAQIAGTIQMLARHGISSLVDFHQDEYGPEFDDNGFPSWMTMTDGLPNVTEVGFPGQYFVNPALERAFDHFWANDVGPDGTPLQADDVAILSHVAAALAHQPGLLGYEILNEPWPGSQYPECAVAAVGCPTFDKEQLGAYYDRVIPAIRQADPLHMIWYEPVSTFNQGVPTSVVPPADQRVGFAFHDYPLCSAGAGAADPAVDPQCSTPDSTETSTVISNALSHVASTGDALLETEFGATTDTDLVADQVTAFDQSMVPWMFWSYNDYIDDVDGNGNLEPVTARNVNTDMLMTLARPYPQLISGTPSGWSFDASTRDFVFRYSAQRPDGHGLFRGGSETDIAVPAIQYPNGYQATVVGGTVVSRPAQPLLRVRSRAGSDQVVVTVTPAAAVP